MSRGVRVDRACLHLRAAAKVIGMVERCCADAIVDAAEQIASAFSSGGKLMLCGNGGSAADCQHLAAEFVSRLTAQFDRGPLPALALTTDSSVLTGFSNDYGYGGVFERQVRALCKPGDVLLGISTSGNSPNVVRAVQAARELGAKTVVLLGSSGALASLSDVAVRVPSGSTLLVQEAHLVIEHVLCELVEEQLFQGGQSQLTQGRHL